MPSMQEPDPLCSPFIVRRNHEITYTTKQQHIVTETFRSQKRPNKIRQCSIKAPTKWSSSRLLHALRAGSRLEICMSLSFSPSVSRTSRTAQGGGGNFKNRKPIQERLVSVMHGWQSRSKDGPKGGALFFPTFSDFLFLDLLF